MADYYVHGSVEVGGLSKKAQQWVKDTLAKFQNLDTPKEDEDWEKLLEDYPFLGAGDDAEHAMESLFSMCDLDGSSVWLHHDMYFDIDVVAVFLQTLFEKFHPDYMVTISWANTCSKPRLDGFSGGSVLVTADKLHWFIPDILAVEKEQELKKAAEGKDI